LLEATSLNSLACTHMSSTDVYVDVYVDGH
jgi:hypothetical protein